MRSFKSQHSTSSLQETPSMKQTGVWLPPIPNDSLMRAQTRSFRKFHTADGMSSLIDACSTPRSFRNSRTADGMSSLIEACSSPSYASAEAVKFTVNIEPPKGSPKGFSANRQRLQRLFHGPSQITVRQMPTLSGSSSSDEADACETGMLRLVYQEVRSIRRSTLYGRRHGLVRNRRCLFDLVHDVRHGIRVCTKARDFIELAMDRVTKSRELKEGVDSSSQGPPTTSHSTSVMWDSLVQFLHESVTPTLLAELSGKLSAHADMIEAQMNVLTPKECQLVAEELEDQLKVIQIRRMQRALRHANSNPKEVRSPTPTNCSNSCSTPGAANQALSTPWLLGRVHSTPSDMIKTPAESSSLGSKSPCCMSRETH